MTGGGCSPFDGAQDERGVQGEGKGLAGRAYNRFVVHLSTRLTVSLPWGSIIDSAPESGLCAAPLALNLVDSP